jgi:hypothetical protein
VNEVSARRIPAMEYPLRKLRCRSGTLVVQVGHEIELGLPQVGGTLGSCDLAGSAIDDCPGQVHEKWSAFQTLARRPARASDDRSKAGHQLLEPCARGNVVVRTRVQGRYDVIGSRGCAEDDEVG